MTRSLLALLLALASVLPTTVRAEEKPLTISDFFLLLPPGAYLKGKPSEQLKYIRDNGQGVVDAKNGYLSLNGYGEQPSLQTTVFLDRADSGLIAVCYGLPGKADFTHLAFFEQAPNAAGGLIPEKRLIPVKRSIFPVGDAPSGSYFSLPREGKTVLVRDQVSNAVRRRFTWKDEGFQEEK